MFYKDVFGLSDNDSCKDPVVIDVDFSYSKQGSCYIMNYLDFAEVTVNIKDHSTQRITLPSSGEINGSDNDALYRWLQSIK